MQNGIEKDYNERQTMGDKSKGKRTKKPRNKEWHKQEDAGS